MTAGRFLPRISNAVRRRWHILSSPHLTPSARLGVVLSRGAVSARAVRGLVRREGDSLTADLDGFTFSVPLPDDDEGRRDRLDAFSQVLAETFVDPLLFRGPVRINPGDVAFDVGAHIGTTAALFSRAVGPLGRVFAFEPGVDDVLRRHVEVNALSNVEVVPAAVGESPGTVELSMGATGLDSSIVHALDWHRAKKAVPVVSLDGFVAERSLDRVDFIKMDIEGAEEPALRGARRLIERFRPRWSISSYHTDALGEPQHPKLVAILKGAGYTVEEVSRFHIFAH